MLNGEIRSKMDALWNAFWTAGIANPLEDIAQSFYVPKADIVAQGYDLSLNRYKEVVHQEVTHRPPGEILKALGQLETEIQQGMKELEGMLK